MSVNKRSGVGHTTTIDAVKTVQTTISRAGQKRIFDEFREKSSENFRTKPPTTDAFKEDFTRPTLPNNCFQHLKAGQIQSLNNYRGPSEYAQRKALDLTPSGTADPTLDLSFPGYGLPKQLVNNFYKLGIRSIYPWQSQCLLQSGALEGDKNLVYTAPTGGGKSLVADILMLKKVIEDPESKALLVLPYVALVQEKLRWLRSVVEGITKNVGVKAANKNFPARFRPRGDENNIRLAGFFGGSKLKASWVDMDIAVCTIEKANALVNESIEDKSVSKLGVVVMDELHMIDDEGRGYILELMATKLLSLGQGVQLIGMSATLNNAELLAKWLDNANFYHSKYRPVPIEEHLVFDNSIYPSSNAKMFFETATQLSAQTQGLSQAKADVKPVRIIEQSQSKELSNSLVNAVVALANETARSDYGALVFCSSRLGCERDAVLISRVLPRPNEVDKLVMEKRNDLLNELRSSTTGLDSTLEKTVPVGVAFHHAGLTTEERDLIATAFENGIIKVIVATCSLAAGINLPARRVILHGARMGADLVGPAMLRQMRGRAGRKGKDEIGETYMCCQKSDLKAVAEIMEAEIPSVQSCLVPEKRGIKRALLEVIATKLATSNEALDDYMQKTLLYHTRDPKELSAMVQSTIQGLEESGLISRGSNYDYSATLVGQAIVASSLSPEDGLFIHRELRKALQAFVIDGELHVLYAFTPVQAAQTCINWQIFRSEVERLDESNLRALGFIGLKPSIINKMAQGSKMKEANPKEQETIRVYHRFYAALQLRDLCNEMPIHAVARKYDLSRGIIQTLAQTCHGFAAGMIKFCKKMDWGALAAVLDHFCDRLKAGAKSDLLALAKVQYIKSRAARVFWENGFKTVAALANANIKDIVPVLLMAQPKKIRIDSFNEEKYIEKLNAKAKVISESANKIWEQEMQAELEEFDES